jgi:hypothetical protein
LRPTLAKPYASSCLVDGAERNLVNIACRERTMSNLNNGPDASSLAVLVECVVSPLVREHPAPVCFELNLPIELTTTADRSRLSELVRSLVRDSLNQMPDGGELCVTGCLTAKGIELEIADTGSDIDNRGHKLSLAAAALGCKPRWQNCPQGGAAVTIVLPSHSAIRKAA